MPYKNPADKKAWIQRNPDKVRDWRLRASAKSASTKTTVEKRFVCAHCGTEGRTTSKCRIFCDSACRYDFIRGGKFRVCVICNDQFPANHCCITCSPECRRIRSQVVDARKRSRPIYRANKRARENERRTKQRSVFEAARKMGLLEGLL